MKNRLYSSVLVVSLAASLAACGSTSTPSPTAATFSLQPTTAAALTVSSGTMAPITVQVTAPIGTSPAGLTLSATTDARYCALDHTSATTDANGNATFNLTPGSVGGVTCTTSVTLLNVSASRGNVAVNAFIRPLQRVLNTPPTVALPAINVTLTDAGTAASTVTVAAPRNLAALDAAHTYGVYLARTDASGTVGGVTLAGRISASTTFPVSFAGPGNLAAGGYNTVGLVLQGTSGLTNLSGNALIGNVAVTTGGSGATVLTLPQTGVTNAAPYTVSGASAQVSLTSPNAALGVGNDSLSLVWSGLPSSPAGTRYVVYSSTGTATTRLGSFDVSTASGTFTYSAPAPANSGGTPSATVTDARANFTRVFVTIEPLSGNDSAFPSAQPGPSVVLDGSLGSWTQSLPLQ